MPFAQIYMLEGRTEEQKKAVIEKVTQALVDAVARRRQCARLDPRRAQRELGHCRGQPRSWGADRDMWQNGL
jgi:hypothetical protein